MHVEHLRVPIGSGALHAERLGRGGPPVVLLHGFGTCAFLWRRLAPSLAMAGYCTIAVDLLGHGESDRPEDASYGLASQAEYLARALAALRLPPCTIIGQDVGGLVGLLLATSPRSNVERLVLISPPDPDDLPGPDIRALQRTSARIALNSNTLFGVRPALAPLLRSGVTSAERMPDLLVARYLAPFIGTDGLSQLLKRATAVELSETARAQLSRAACPILVVEGDAAPPRPSLSWPTLLRSSTVTANRVHGTSWLVPEDAPERLNELVFEWLERQRSH